MANDKLKTVYICTECGEISPRWMGKCPSCEEWNTLVEDIVKQTSKSKTVSLQNSKASYLKTEQISDISIKEKHSRIITQLSELDRVLGGGIVLGSVVLLGGEPGAGKSTLLLQICAKVSEKTSVLYVTGEESARQIKLRAVRLNVTGEQIALAAQTDVDLICELIKSTKPGLVVIDSIQTMLCSELTSTAGSVSQVKECTARLLQVAKSIEVPTFIVGHVNKDGAIAGPKVMEHMVDTVLYFEGDKTLPYRVLRAVKNRYGSTNEIGMFDMTSAGLKAIENPSQLLLEGRPVGVSGNCVACAMEGTRPILSEIQALVTKTGFGTPRRAATGFDYNRMNLLLAVIEKRAGYSLSALDVYINIVGGLELDETACDLPVCLALISAVLDKPVQDKMLAMGEVGLGGEIRNVSNINYRLKEAHRMGFTQAIIPKQTYDKILQSDFPSMEIIGVSHISQAIGLL